MPEASAVFNRLGRAAEHGGLPLPFGERVGVRGFLNSMAL
jgi:hypothetical protein